MLKKPVLLIAVVVAVLLAVIFVYRYQILQYTTESLIRKYLPPYVKIDSIRFDFGKSEASLNGFKILNSPGFSKEYLVEVEKIICHYKLKGKTIPDGLELIEPVLTGAILNIERLDNGKLNLEEAQVMITGKTPTGRGNDSVSENSEKQASQVNTLAPAEKKSASVIKLPEKFTVKAAKVFFVDRMEHAQPVFLSFENINAELILKMDEFYTKILSCDSAGEGDVAGDRTQTVKWVVSLNPNTPRLTLSSRFEVSDVKIVPFEPYYDKYSPFVFRSGKFSGLLIFDLDNGVIGSSDELRLSGLKFYVKPGYENAIFWETTVPDLVKYFTSAYGEVIFDFKIKGEMASPQFYLGPKSKEALVYMAVDKVSEAIQKSSSGSGGAKSDLEKAKDYIDMFKGLLKK
jgi:hypothetical protein